MNSAEKPVLDLDAVPVEVSRTAIWKARDGDCPVTIVCYLGIVADGRR